MQVENLNMSICKYMQGINVTLYLDQLLQCPS